MESSDFGRHRPSGSDDEVPVVIEGAEVGRVQRSAIFFLDMGPGCRSLPKKALQVIAEGYRNICIVRR